MRAVITDGKNAGKIIHLTESEIDLSDVVEKDRKTGAYRMTEADATWFKGVLREASTGRKLQEIQENRARETSDMEYPKLEKDDMIALCEKKVTAPNRSTTYWNEKEGTFTCYSKKLRTLGCNEHVFKQKGRLITLRIYMDATNSRETKYFKIVD
jgi:hypothetical protein